MMNGVLLGTIAIGVTGGLLAWRERPEPGSVPLAVMLAAQCLWSATLVFKLQATTFGAKIFWLNMSWIGVAVIPVAWLLFSLEYSGYTKYVRFRYIAPISIVPTITIGLALTYQYHDLIYLSEQLVESGAVSTPQAAGIWYWVSGAYTYLLGIAGIIPLLGLVRSDVQAFQGQSSAILVGLLVPWVTNALYLMEAMPTNGVDPTPVAFSISGIAYLGAVTRFQLFKTNPSPKRYARHLVFDQMQEGALVLDNNDYIVGMNDSAAHALNTTRTEALGSPADANFSSNLFHSHDTSKSDQTIIHTTDGNRSYDISMTRITDFRNRTIGRVITLHEITEYLQQQQQLEVLNRVFRHNIRNKTQVIVGNADQIETNDTVDQVEKVIGSAMEIEAIGQKMREVIDVFEQRRTHSNPLKLHNLLDEIITATRENHPAVSIEYEPGSDELYVPEMLEVVFSNVIENAVIHNTHPEPHVRIEVSADDKTAQITTKDNGPGIDDQELLVLERDTETPLEHGSGLGLSVIAWATDIADGEVTFEANEPTGTIVTVNVPIQSTPTQE